MMTTKEAFETREQTGRDIRKVSDYSGHEEFAVTHSPECPHNAPLKGSPRCKGGYRVEGTDICGWTEIRPEGLYPECVREAFDAEGKYHRTCSGPGEALYMETTHVGVVLSLGEVNGYDDSDFYAVVWNGTRPERVTYASTRGWTYPNNAAIDATPEVLAAFAQWQDEQRKAAQAARDAERKAAIEAEKRRPARGKAVEVVRGRKVPIGFSGLVFWEGTDNYGKARVGIKNAAGDVKFTAASNCEVRG